MKIFSTNLDPLLIAFVIILSVLQFTIKGFALWQASRFTQRNWFIVLFILIPLNDLGIIEVIYLFRFAKKRLTIKEIRSFLRLG